MKEDTSLFLTTKSSMSKGMMAPTPEVNSFSQRIMEETLASTCTVVTNLSNFLRSRIILIVVEQ